MAAVEINVSYDDYLESVIISATRYKNWRLGQTMFNVLAELRPDIAERVRATEADPFYADAMQHGYEKVANFLAFVREEW
jgi:hypothetical protein